jgi:flagellar hook assembly protein FlgD
LTVFPPIFDPTGFADDGTPALSHAQFTLNRAGDAELAVYDADTGVLVRRQMITGLASGPQAVTWDGRNDAGVLVEPGRYRLSVTGVDAFGARSITIYALQRVYY